MSGTIEYGWRRFGTQQTSSDGTGNSFQVRGSQGIYVWIAEIVGQEQYPSVFGGEEFFSSPYISVNPDSSLVSSGDTVLLGAVMDAKGSSFSSSPYWSLVGEGEVRSDIITGRRPTGVWVASGDSSYQTGFLPGSVRGFTYICISGSIRQYAQAQETLPGAGPTIVFPKTPLSGSLILACVVNGVYAEAGGYQQDPLYDWLLATDYPYIFTTINNQYKASSIKWQCKFFNTGDSNSVTEGWVTENLYLSNRVATLSGNPAKGTISVYSNTGKKLEYKTDWTWSSIYQNKIKINSSWKLSEITVTYLNVASRLRYNAPRRLVFDQSTTHDRMRYNDIKGL